MDPHQAMLLMACGGLIAGPSAFLAGVALARRKALDPLRAMLDVAYADGHRKDAEVDSHKAVIRAKTAEIDELRCKLAAREMPELHPDVDAEPYAWSEAVGAFVPEADVETPAPPKIVPRVGTAFADDDSEAHYRAWLAKQARPGEES